MCGNRFSCTSRRRSRTTLGWRRRNFSRFTTLNRSSRRRTFCPGIPLTTGSAEVRDELLSPIPRTPEAMRRHLADYYATLTHLDPTKLAAYLKLCDAAELLENTVVIYSSDQGLAVGGRHGLMGKQNLYEHVKPPLIVSGPGIPHGRSDTLVYLSGPVPDNLRASPACARRGRSKERVCCLQGYSRRVVTRVRDRPPSAAYRDCQRMIRDERFKLIEYHAAE